MTEPRPYHEVQPPDHPGGHQPIFNATLCWADRLAVGAWVLLLLLGALMWNGGAIENNRISDYIEVISIVALIIWVILRIVDWVFGGPTFRRDRRSRSY
jgi:hypothetical protein